MSTTFPATISQDIVLTSRTFTVQAHQASQRPLLSPETSSQLDSAPFVPLIVSRLLVLAVSC